MAKCQKRTQLTPSWSLLALRRSLIFLRKTKTSVGAVIIIVIDKNVVLGEEETATRITNENEITIKLNIAAVSPRPLDGTTTPRGEAEKTTTITTTNATRFNLATHFTKDVSFSFEILPFFLICSPFLFSTRVFLARQPYF